MTSVPACQEVQRRFDVFLDGELDGRTMRSLALHVTRCPECEEELRRLEKIQDVFARVVQNEVDEVDVAALWNRIEGSVERLPAPLRDRWMPAWGDVGRFGAPVFAAATIGAIAALLWTLESRPADLAKAPEPPVNTARIERLASAGSDVVVWSEPETDTTAIWVVGSEP